MQVYNNMKNYRLHKREKSMDELPFEWDSVHSIPDVAQKHNYKAYLVYAYIHSGVVFSRVPFADKWDSGVACVLLFPKKCVRSTYKVDNFIDKLNGEYYD